MRSRSLALLLLVALVVLAAGCGGGDSSESAGADTTTVEETSTTEESTHTTEETPDVDLGDLSKECLSLASVGAKYAQALQEAGAAASGSGDLSTLADLFDEFVSEAPEEIRGDLAVLAENITKYADALKDLDLSAGSVPNADQIAKLQELSAGFDTEELQQASQNVEAWVESNCSSNG
jgi:uncharacterized phage infection (PIP) family protein YhgE